MFNGKTHINSSNKQYVILEIKTHFKKVFVIEYEYTVLNE